MDDHDIHTRFLGRLPTKGVAFLVNDPVVILKKEHLGKRGVTVSISRFDPKPIYIVELDNGRDLEIAEVDLLPTHESRTEQALEELARWYSSQCDEDWEHQQGIRIGTLDNPGWSVSINLVGTELLNIPFAPIDDVDDDRSWITCRIHEGRFEGHCGPLLLGAVIGIFLRWAKDQKVAT